MFCFQCEQTRNGTGCQTDAGVCGKDAATADLQDLLLAATVGISQYAHAARLAGGRDRVIDRFVLSALFTTVTNVNFDAVKVLGQIADAVAVRERSRDLYISSAKQAGRPPETFAGPATMALPTDLVAARAAGQAQGIVARQARLGADRAGLQELLTYGLKGLAAYAHHAEHLGFEDEAIYATLHELLAQVADEQATVPQLLGWCLAAGELNLRVMALLDQAHTQSYGHPRPTQVRVTPVKGKCILISGHDLKDLKDLLEQTQGLGINVYTHGEMLPGHGYPELHKYPHLAGNYGGAWQLQAGEFDRFPGPILMTTNCIQQPRESYKARIFSTGMVAWPGVVHVTSGQFQPVIAAALAAPGFAADEEAKYVTVGFGHDAVLGVADKVVAAVKSGAIRHFFLVGGCDGAKPGRNYFTKFCQQVPEDCMILTLACGKFRFNKLEFGTIGGLPRLLDLGQCNDAYSAIKIASALAGAFNCGVNELPLSMVLSWYEQKAVAILLTLLHLGIRNIRLGPSLPAFVTPAALAVLVEKFNLQPTHTPQEDLAAILGK